MSSTRSLFLVLCGVAAVSAQAPTQTPFKTDTSAIVVDVVVRDKKGSPVTDLTARDFELVEDGVPQTIASLTLVAPGERTKTAAARGSGPAPAVPPPAPGASRPRIAATAFTALVFDSISTQARAQCYEAARSFLGRLGPDDFVGIFASELSLIPVTAYTTDKSRLEQGLKQVTTRPGRLSDPHTPLPAVAGAEWGGRSDLDAGASEVMAATHNGWDRLERDQSGYATTNALSAVATGLSVLPGRKTMIVFAERLAIPDAVKPRLQEVIATANRGNISIYTVDAEGLRVHSSDSETAQEIRAMGNAGLTFSSDGSNMSSLGMMERNEDVLRKDPRTSLQLLAEPTGGFLIDSTNDLTHGLATIDQDRRFHYLLTYTPQKQTLDGTWRTITVKVPKRPVQIRARSGYLAAPGASGVPLLAYEAPALAALDARPLPRRVPLKANAISLLTRAGAPRVAVVVTTDASALTFKPNAMNDAFVTDFTILARIKDAQGAVVRKASEPYRLSGPLADQDRAQRGEVLFFRQPELPPGAYMLEAAVHDAMADTAGARFVPFTVYEPSPHGLLVSSLVLVQRTERVGSATPEDTNPLRTGDLLLYPRLGDPYKKGTDAAVSFFVRLKVPSGAAAPTATLVLLRNGQPAATLPLPLPAPDTQGVIDHTAQLPLDALPVGDYTLRLIVKDAGDEVVRETPFRVVE